MNAGKPKRSNFKQSDVTRVLKGAEKAGLKPESAQIEQDGSIRVFFAGSTQKSRNPWDEAFQQ